MNIEAERIRAAVVSLGERVVFHDMAEPPPVRFVDMCIHLARTPSDGPLVLRVDKPGRPGVRLDFVGAAGPGLQPLRDRIEAARLREAQR